MRCHRHVFNVRTGVKLNVAVRFHRIKNVAVQISAMGDGIRILEACAKRLAHGNRCDLAAIDRIHHHHAIGEHAAFAYGVAHAQRVERSKRIRPQLQACTDLADAWCLL